MGIFGHRFYFRDGLPKVQAIKDKFFEITGLKLGYYSTLHLGELIPESEDIAFSHHRNLEDVAYIQSAEFTGDRREIKRNMHYTGYTFFTCHGFLDIRLENDITAGGKSFDILCGGRAESLYFYYALIKSVLELGGNTYLYNTYTAEADPEAEEKLELYLPHERFWKRIKKWDELCAVERAAFNGFYV